MWLINRGVAFCNAPGNKGGLKCILVDSTWYIPIEFEHLGGKSKAKHWKKSIILDDSSTPLGTYLLSGGIVFSKSPRQLSPARPGDAGNTNLLMDPILAFIKAYRLKGDLVDLNLNSQ